MKANELMIGDWVKLKDAKLGNINFVGPYVQIKSITGRHVLVPNAKGLLEDVTEEYLLPIPLTGEILEKNGWAKCNEDDDGSVQYEFETDSMVVDWWTPSDGKPGLFGCASWKDANDSCTHEIINELPINHVHELQNAMRLCGINKDFVL